MNRRDFIRSAGILGASLIVPRCALSKRDKPNIVFFGSMSNQVGN